MKKLIGIIAIVIAITLILVVVVPIVEGKSGGSGNIKGQCTVVLRDDDTNQTYAATESINKADMWEGMMLSYAGGIRQTSFKPVTISPSGTIAPLADYASSITNLKALTSYSCWVIIGATVTLANIDQSTIHSSISVSAVDTAYTTRSGSPQPSGYKYPFCTSTDTTSTTSVTSGAISITGPTSYDQSKSGSVFSYIPSGQTNGVVSCQHIVGSDLYNVMFTATLDIHGSDTSGINRDATTTVTLQMTGSMQLGSISLTVTSMSGGDA